ncbi:MAG TPA: hypothetical protein PK063_19025, partial [Nitrospira sp.]|nr:hypothetical protein [Nitrospira sp.]
MNSIPAYKPCRSDIIGLYLSQHTGPVINAFAGDQQGTTRHRLDRANDKPYKIEKMRSDIVQNSGARAVALLSKTDLGIRLHTFPGRILHTHMIRFAYVAFKQPTF